jgi:hypothetical protein
MSDKDCDLIPLFIRDNMYPIIKKFDNAYLTKLDKSDNVLILAALNTKTIDHVNFLESFFHNIALQRRRYIFSYIDNSEKYILDYFKLPQEDSIRVVIYDFRIGKFYLDDFRYSKDIESFERLNEILNKLDNNELPMSTGYVFEDTLNKLGIRLSREGVIIFFFFILAVVLSLVLILCCQCIDNKDKLKTN